jgi:flagellar basal-body rod modification protein FlgD
MASAISATDLSGIQASQAATRKTIAGNFDTFLQLLTTQLQNQNPLDPLDTNQFTQQLVQFTGVEQSLKTNDLLATLIGLSASSNAATAAGYLGASITADGSSASLTEGEANWAFKAAKPAAKATFTVVDSAGATVYSETRALDAGPGEFKWDGRSNDGSLYTSGQYTLKVDAKDAAGQSVTVSTEIAGTVSAVDVTTNPPTLSVGSLSVPLDKVKTLRRTGS